MNIKKGAQKYTFYYTISQTSFHCSYLTVYTLQRKVKEYAGFRNFSLNMLSNNTHVHCCTSLKAGLYEKCPEDKSKAWNWTKSPLITYLLK